MEMRRLPHLYKTAVIGLSTAVLLYGQSVFAQESITDTPAQEYLMLFLAFINNLILPLLFSIALLFFLINIARYFIIKSGNEGDREKARKLALYGIGAFVALVSLWGIVNMFVFGLRINDEEAICPDYLGDWCYNGFSEYGDDQGGFFLDENGFYSPN